MSLDRSHAGLLRGMIVASLIASGIAAGGCDGGDEIDYGFGPEENWSRVSTADRTWQVLWRPIPAAMPTLEPFSVEILVFDQAGRTPGDDVSVMIDATMPHHGHGMNVVPEVTREGESWLAEGVLLHMPGRWEFTIDVERDGEVERAQWTEELES